MRKIVKLNIDTEHLNQAQSENQHLLFTLRKLSTTNNNISLILILL